MGVSNTLRGESILPDFTEIMFRFFFKKMFKNKTLSKDSWHESI